MLDLLASKGANLNFSTRTGVTLAHIAARGGDSNCLAVLCERGADVDAANQSGNTPIMFAALAGALDVSSCVCAVCVCMSGCTCVFIVYVCGYRYVICTCTYVYVPNVYVRVSMSVCIRTCACALVSSHRLGGRRFLLL